MSNIARRLFRDADHSKSTIVAAALVVEVIGALVVLVALRLSH